MSCAFQTTTGAKAPQPASAAVSPLLLLDLDNTVADRATPFEHWAETQLDQWAPGDQGAMAFLHEQDGDRRYDSCPRTQGGVMTPSTPAWWQTAQGPARRPGRHTVGAEERERLFGIDVEITRVAPSG